MRPLASVVTGITTPAEPDFLIEKVSECLKNLGVETFQIYTGYCVKQNKITWMVWYPNMDGTRVFDMLSRRQYLTTIGCHIHYSSKESRGFYNYYWEGSQDPKGYIVRNGSEVRQTGNCRKLRRRSLSGPGWSGFKS